MKRIAWVPIGLFALITAAHAANLDCKKARSKVEHLICDEKNNPALWSLDNEMNSFYGHVLRESVNKRDVLKVQKQWLKEVRNVCADATCLKKAYEGRIAELQEAATLCKAQELVVFSCALPKKRIVSLCSSQDASPDTGYMQYRMGNKLAELEMEYPQHKVPAKDGFKYASWLSSKAGTYGVSFWNKDDRYSLVLSQGAIGYNGAGVILSHGHPPVQVSVSKCLSDPIVFDTYQNGAITSFYLLGDNLNIENADEDIDRFEEDKQ